MAKQKSPQEFLHEPSPAQAALHCIASFSSRTGGQKKSLSCHPCRRFVLCNMRIVCLVMHQCTMETVIVDRPICDFRAERAAIRLGV